MVKLVLLFAAFLLGGCASSAPQDERRIELRRQILIDGQVQERVPEAQGWPGGLELPAPKDAQIAVERQYVPESQWPVAWKRVPRGERLSKEEARRFIERFEHCP